MRYNDYIRGTKTGRTYKYADCKIFWDITNERWFACAPNSNSVIAVANGIKPMRDILHGMKIRKEGPWA